MFINNNQVLHSGNWSSYCAAASHSHSYLPLSGGTATGTIHVKQTNVDMKQTNNGTSSTVWGQGFRTIDKNGLLSFYIQPTYYSSGDFYLDIGSRNYNTSGDQVAWALVNLVTTKNGVGYVFVASPFAVNSASYGSSLPTSSLMDGRVFYKLV